MIVPASTMQAVGELDANAFGLLTFAVAGEDTYLLNNFIQHHKKPFLL